MTHRSILLPIALISVPANLSRGRWGVGSPVLLWDETRNPAGCHKYAAARAVVRRLPDECRVVTVGTCGSYGRAIAMVAAERGLATTLFISRRTSFAMAPALAGRSVSVHREGDTYEEAVALSKAWAEAREDVADVNVDGPFGGLFVDCVAERTAEALGDSRAAGPIDFWVPTGNGTTLAGIEQGAVGRSATRLFAVTSRGNNSIAHSQRKGAVHCPLPPSAVHETPANVSLCSWNALHGEAALNAVRRSGGEVCEVGDGHLVRAAGELSRLGIDASPAGAAGLAGLLRLRPGSAGRHIVLVTGRPAS